MGKLFIVLAVVAVVANTAVFVAAFWLRRNNNRHREQLKLKREARRQQFP